MSISNLLSLLIGSKNTAKIISYYQEKKLRHKYYSDDINSLQILKDDVIYMADGRIKHGGLSDRLRGIVSLYIYCKNQGINFAINFNHPFNLSDYLISNQYDWYISERDLTYSYKDTRPVVIRPYKNCDNEQLFSTKICHNKIHKQLHVYSNVTYQKYNFGSSFNELFRPSSALNEQITYHLSKIGGQYVSITFRFQQLLGDFKEGNYKILNNEDRRALIGKCISAIERIKSNNPEITKVLVTSDSTTFLKIAEQKIPYIYYVPGDVFHIEYSINDKQFSYMKSFLDLFMISKAKIVYFYSTGSMYKNSAFAETAALIGGTKYIKIEE